MPARITEVAVDRARRQLVRSARAGQESIRFAFLSFCVDHTLTDTLSSIFSYEVVAACLVFFFSHEVVAACLDGAATRSIFFLFSFPLCSFLHFLLYFYITYYNVWTL
jgi:hypothetical protein